MIFGLNLEQITINTNFLKMFFMEICIGYSCLKITNSRIEAYNKSILVIIYFFVISIISSIIRYQVDYLASIIVLIFLLTLVYSKLTKSNWGYATLVVLISYSVNYIFIFIGAIIDFFINTIYIITNDYLNLGIITIVQIFLLLNTVKIRRIKHGIEYLNNKIKDEYLDIIILNISVIITFCSVLFNSMDIDKVYFKQLFFSFIIFAIIMFVTIQKSIQLYYKQKLLIQDLTETKSDLKKSKQEIQKLEKENIELSKKNHSFNHKYKALEHKLKEHLLKTEIAEEISLKDQLDDLSKEIYVVPQNTDLSKTNIEKIDDMLKFMQSECDEHKITFNLQVIGNIYHMTNNFISQEELQILIADHIKDAIIAINHSDNINKSILVKLGKIEDYYGLYIYDSGIEFDKETLENLGKKPITTHINEGGSGMGFMNTFDTLRRHNASLIIEELGKPCKENFTKIIKFRFDGKNEFKVISYRNK